METEKAGERLCRVDQLLALRSPGLRTRDNDGGLYSLRRVETSSKEEREEMRLYGAVVD